MATEGVGRAENEDEGEPEAEVDGAAEAFGPVSVPPALFCEGNELGTVPTALGICWNETLLLALAFLLAAAVDAAACSARASTTPA